MQDPGGMTSGDTHPQFRHCTITHRDGPTSSQAHGRQEGQEGGEWYVQFGCVPKLTAVVPISEEG